MRKKLHIAVLAFCIAYVGYFLITIYPVEQEPSQAENQAPKLKEEAYGQPTPPPPKLRIGSSERRPVREQESTGIPPETAPTPEGKAVEIYDTGVNERSVWQTTKEGIDGAIREVMPEIRSCYQDWMLEYPDLDGRLQVKFTIGDVDGEGKILSAEAVDELDAAPFSACVVNVMSSLQFDIPEQGGIVIVRYPFFFSQE